MVNWRKQLGPTIAATSLLLASGTLANGVSQAEEAILIPGAMPFKRINPIYPIVAQSYPDIGKNFHNDDDKQIVAYSQNPLAADWALRDGVTQASAAVLQTIERRQSRDHRRIDGLHGCLESRRRVG